MWIRGQGEPGRWGIRNAWQRGHPESRYVVTEGGAYGLWEPGRRWEGEHPTVSVDSPIIGMAGGIGSGKSMVASMLAEMGARVIDSDRVNHAELNDPEVIETLKDWWGSQVMTPSGQADRQAIRRIVRDDAVARHRLEALMHPRIARRSEALLASYRQDPQVKAVVWDAPLLFEVGLDERCDAVIYVDADPQVRFDRVARRHGSAHGRDWSRDDFERMENSQKPLDFKKARADYIIENNSDTHELRRQVEDVFSRILSGV